MGRYGKRWGKEGEILSWLTQNGNKVAAECIVLLYRSFLFTVRCENNLTKRQVQKRKKHTFSNPHNDITPHTNRQQMYPHTKTNKHSLIYTLICTQTDTETDRRADSDTFTHQSNWYNSPHRGNVYLGITLVPESASCWHHVVPTPLCDRTRLVIPVGFITQLLPFGYASLHTDFFSLTPPPTPNLMPPLLLILPDGNINIKPT